MRTIEDINNSHSTPVYLDRTSTEDILEDKINLWKCLIDEKENDLEIFENYETHVLPVVLLIAYKIMMLEDEIEKCQKELFSFIKDQAILKSIKE